MSQLWRACRGGGTYADPRRSATIASSVVAWTANTHDGWGILRIVLPAEYGEVREEVLDTIDALLPPFPVVRAFSSRNVHAKVCLVRYGEELAVCKMFRRHSRKHLLRERNGLSLHPNVPGIPALLASDENWILMEYLEGFREARVGWWGFFPIEPVRQAFESLRQLHELGYSLLDFHSGNILVREREGRLIDLEHLYKYPATSQPAFERSPAIIGSAYFEQRGEAGGWERAGPGVAAQATWYPTYERNWKPLLGVSLDWRINDRMSARFAREPVQSAIGTLYLTQTELPYQFSADVQGTWEFGRPAEGDIPIPTLDPLQGPRPQESPEPDADADAETPLPGTPAEEEGGEEEEEEATPEGA